MMKKLILFLLPVGFLLTGLNGCAEKPVAYMTGKVPASHKVSAPVSIAYTTPKKMALGDSALITITVTTNANVDDLTLIATGGEGLLLPDGSANNSYEVHFGPLVNNSSRMQEVLISPDVEGLLYLNLLVTGEFSGRKMGRAGAVPVTVGDDARKMLKATGKQKVDSSGQVLLISPAEEL